MDTGTESLRQDSLGAARHHSRDSVEHRFEENLKELNAELREVGERRVSLQELLN